MAISKRESLLARMEHLKRQLRAAQQEHDQRESKRAYRAVRAAGLTAADVERLLAQATKQPTKELSDDHSDHGSPE